MLLFMAPKSSLFSSDIYREHSLLPLSRTHPSSNQERHALILEFLPWTSKSSDTQSIFFLSIIYSPVN